MPPTDRPTRPICSFSNALWLQSLDLLTDDDDCSRRRLFDIGTEQALPQGYFWIAYRTLEAKKPFYFLQKSTGTVSLAIATTTIKCFGVMIGLQVARSCCQGCPSYQKWPDSRLSDHLSIFLKKCFFRVIKINFLAITLIDKQIKEYWFWDFKKHQYAWITCKIWS